MEPTSRKSNVIIIALFDLHADVCERFSRLQNDPGIALQLNKAAQKFYGFLSPARFGASQLALLTCRYPFRGGDWGMPGSEGTIAGRKSK